MIIMDLQQVMIANLMVQLGNHKNAEVEENMLRHMILNSIRANKVKFGAEFGEFIIACDDKNYWRRSIFQYYKASRKKDREASELDWNAIFAALNKIRDELKQYFPYRVIQVDTAEADDVIATLCHRFGTLLGDGGEKILILSGDKDYIQLQTYSNVKQFDPVRKRYITHPNPDVYRAEHIMRGDRGDGIPNFLSPGNVFVVGGRQKPLSEKKLAEWVRKDPSEFCNEEMMINYKRNQTLIDLSFIPTHVSDAINAEYDNQAGKSRIHLFNYFINNRLKYLMENIGDF